MGIASADVVVWIIGHVRNKSSLQSDVIDLAKSLRGQKIVKLSSTKKMNFYVRSHPLWHCTDTAAQDGHGKK